MARQPYVGSGRPIEGGILAATKQDLNAHVQGSVPLRHKADQIDTNPPIAQFPDPTVQGTLEKIGNLLSTAGSYVTISDGYGTADYTVGTAGVPTLEFALSLAFANPRLQAGGVILIKAGTYIMQSKVTVPAGFTILGEGRGTVLVGHMGNQSMFRVSRGLITPTIGNGNNYDAGAPLDAVRFMDIVLTDNFDNVIVDGTGAIPTMQTVPMIECQIGSRLECEQVSFIGKVGLTTFAGTPVTKCAIGYVSGASTGTHLVTTRCYFDGFGTAIQFNPGSGIEDYLTVEGCRARTFGNDTDPITKSNNCFVAFTLCNAKFVNNYFIGAGSVLHCFAQLSSTISGTYPRVVIMGNSGGINGGSGFLLGDFTEQMYSIINNNSFGNDFSPSWYVTIGDGTDTVNGSGDINGQFALEAVLNNSGGPLITNGTYVYIKGRSHIVRKSLTQSSVRLIGVKIDRLYPLVTLDLSASSVTDEAARKTLLVGNYVSDIEFTSTGSGFKSLELTWSTAFGDGQVKVENCYFRNVGLTVQKLSSMNFVIDLTGAASKNSIEITNSNFNQTGSYAEDVSLLIPEANNILLSGCSFRGKGYVGLIGTLGSVFTGFSFPGSANTQKTNQITVENCEMDLTGNIITGNSPLSSNSYFIIQSTTASVNLKNTRIMADNTFNPGGIACLPATATSFCNFSGLNISLEDCVFNGSTQEFIASSVVFAMPTLFLSPKQNLYVNNCRVLYGAFPIQVSGSNVLSTDPLHGINIHNSEFLTTSSCALDIDTKFDTLVVSDGFNAIQPKINITGCTFHNNIFVGTGPRRIQHLINNSNDAVGAYYTCLGIVQVYASNCDVSFINNYISGFLVTVGTIGSPYLGFAGLVINNFDSPTSPGTNNSGLTQATTKISYNNIQVDNRFEAVNDATFAANVFIKSPYLNVSNNTMGMLNNADSIAPPASNYTSFMVVSNHSSFGVSLSANLSSGIITGNSFQRLQNSLNVMSRLKRAAIHLTEQSRQGMFVDNDFNSAFLRDDGSPTDTALFVDDIGNWLIERNVNQTTQVSLNCGTGNYTIDNVLLGATTAGVTFQFGTAVVEPPRLFYIGGSGFITCTWEIPVNDILPNYVYVTGASVQVSAAENAFTSTGNVTLVLSSAFPQTIFAAGDLGPIYTSPDTVNILLPITASSDFLKFRNISSNRTVLRMVFELDSSTDTVITISNMILSYRW